MFPSLGLAKSYAQFLSNSPLPRESSLGPTTALKGDVACSVALSACLPPIGDWSRMVTKLGIEDKSVPKCSFGELRGPNPSRDNSGIMAVAMIAPIGGRFGAA